MDIEEVIPITTGNEDPAAAIPTKEVMSDKENTDAPCSSLIRPAAPQRRESGSRRSASHSHRGYKTFFQFSNPVTNLAAVVNEVTMRRG